MGSGGGAYRSALRTAAGRKGAADDESCVGTTDVGVIDVAVDVGIRVRVADGMASLRGELSVCASRA